MIDTGSLLCLVLVSVLWGFTNPLMKRASVGIEDVRGGTRMRQLVAEMRFLAFNWKYVSAFLINQLGAVLYYWTLGGQDLTTTVIVTNSLTLVFTTVAGQLLGERRDTKLTYMGMALVTLGVSVCVWSKA